MKRDTSHLLTYMLYTLAALACFGGAYSVYETVGGGFSSSAITYPGFRPAEEWKNGPVDKELLAQIFEQKFYFSKFSNHTYTFVSKDGEYLLKFFKFSSPRDGGPPSRRRLRHLKRLLASYYAAKDENGLVFLHLAPSNNLQISARMRGWLGVPYTITLDQVPFVLQRNATPTRNVLMTLLNRGDVETAKTRIGQLLAMYAADYQRGLQSRDHNVARTTGFLDDGTPVRLDLGKMTYNKEIMDPAIWHKDLQKIKRRIRSWLRRYYPRFQSEISRDIEEKIYTLTS